MRTIQIRYRLRTQSCRQAIHHFANEHVFSLRFDSNVQFINAKKLADDNAARSVMERLEIPARFKETFAFKHALKFDLQSV